MTASDDAGYVHDPDAFDEDGNRRGDEATDRTGDDDAWLEEPIHPESIDREFGRRGWILVGMIVLAFIVAPGMILLIPPDTSYLFALLIIPLVPAVLLALTAVWATTRP
ncbi:hypothetical protein [Natronosalvus vescus]|uniref:hypothetical protein n=1 Tax=Natronosalvus vescus TaxID=2953881 RepID=UPI002091C4C1|nr:hypothetical protein [Natronosalvus vescus]